MLRNLSFSLFFFKKNNNKMNVVWTKNINVFLVGLAFLLVFTAFQTMSNIQVIKARFQAKLLISCGSFVILIVITHRLLEVI